jgi:hypothetical protein
MLVFLVYRSGTAVAGSDVAVSVGRSSAMATNINSAHDQQSTQSCIEKCYKPPSIVSYSTDGQSTHLIPVNGHTRATSSKRGLGVGVEGQLYMRLYLHCTTKCRHERPSCFVSKITYDRCSSHAIFGCCSGRKSIQQARRSRSGFFLKLQGTIGGLRWSGLAISYVE